MINEIVSGDITSPENPRHIIIGMNCTLEDVNGIGIPYAAQLKDELDYPLTLGSVLSFRFDETRNLHMIVCHKIGRGGWKKADHHVRFGLDYIHQVKSETGDFSIVQIGRGKVGVRDGADAAAIHTAMATSYLPVTLFVRDNTPSLVAPVEGKSARIMTIYRAWHPNHGQQLVNVG